MNRQNWTERPKQTRKAANITRIENFIHLKKIATFLDFCREYIWIGNKLL